MEENLTGQWVEGKGTQKGTVLIGILKRIKDVLCDRTSRQDVAKG